ncbi:MAG: TetR family transcriptional regulator [Streptosporangiaceae bacterium]
MTTPLALPDPDAGPGCPEGLRERKKLATRHGLAVAAIRLAVERGLDNFLVEDIAAAAGVSPRTFNNYFASKYEAICALPADRGRLIGAALRARPAGEPLWQAITRAVLDQHAAADRAPDPEWIAGVRLVIRSPALQGEFLKSQYVMREALAAAIAERTGTDAERDMYPKIVAGAVVSAAGVAMEQWLRAEPPVPLAPLMAQALRQLTSGLPSEPLAPGPPPACGPPTAAPPDPAETIPARPAVPAASASRT